MDICTTSSDSVHSSKDLTHSQLTQPVSITNDSQIPSMGSSAEKPCTSSPTRKVLSRKRHGASRPILVSMKRKPQFTRMYSNDVYEADETPFLGMLVSTPSLSVGEVQAAIDSQLDSIVQVGDVHRGIGIIGTHEYRLPFPF